MSITVVKITNLGDVCVKWPQIHVTTNISFKCNMLIKINQTHKARYSLIEFI